MTRIKLTAAVLLAGLLAGSGPVLASGLRLPASYRSWTIEHEDGGETTLSQLHLPIVVSLSPWASSDLVFSTAGVADTRNPRDAEKQDFGSATDVVAQGFWRTWNDRLLLEAGANLPTGKTSLTEDELELTEALSHPLLGFRNKQAGRGLDLSLGAAVAFPLSSRLSAGLGAGYVRRGSYTLLEGAEDYQPGSGGSVSVGMDLLETGGRAGASPLIRADATYRFYSADELGDRTIFEEGDQIEIHLTGRTPGTGFRSWTMGRLVVKQDNTAFAEEGDVVEAITQSAGTAVTLGLGMDLPLSDRLRGGFEGEWRRFDGGENSHDNGNALGLGPVITLGLGERTLARLSALWSTGTLEGSDGEPDWDLSGIMFGLTLQWRAGSRGS